MTEPVIAVIGLGYVGLPLAVEFGRHFRTIGFDNDASKIAHYQSGTDPMGEVDEDLLAASSHLEFTSDPDQLAAADYIIIAVPTPVDATNNPDLTSLLAATRLTGAYMQTGTTVIFESTVYPGATEEHCIPALETESGLRHAQDFSVAYSPERVNPGDRQRRLPDVVKVVGADTPATLDRVTALYRKVIHAGLHPVSSIKVAEAAKVIENIQRDLNIALMNELAVIFHMLGIDTLEVLEAAGSKWNFLPFRPGLVGGHCIGVDPYYLTHKAETLGYHPEVILAGRRINDGMAAYVASQTVKALIQAGSPVKGARIEVLGLTFKENCRDIRNSKVVDLVSELEDYGCKVSVHDPMADTEQALSECGISLTPERETESCLDALILAVPHANFLELSPNELVHAVRENGLFVDVKSAVSIQQLREDLTVWRL